MQSSRCKVQSSDCRVQSIECRVQGAGFKKSSGCRVQGSECRVQGAGSRVQGAGFRGVPLDALLVPRDSGREHGDLRRTTWGLVIRKSGTSNTEIWKSDFSSAGWGLGVKVWSYEFWA